MKRIFILTVLCIPVIGLGQNYGNSTLDCISAVSQLQSYAQQVNQTYYNEFHFTIPNNRCPAYDGWGRAYNPLAIQNCRNQMVINLNIWYSQQSNYVNNWYMSIASSCSDNGPDGEIYTRPAPRRRSDENENRQISTVQIEELSKDIDGDRQVRISIPRTAEGFRPRN
jgi:hypothetical protein